MKADAYLQQATDALTDRAATRDAADGERSMAATVTAFNAIYGTELSEEMGWQFMVLLKMVRGSQGGFRADDYVDQAGYSGLAGEAAEKERSVPAASGVPHRAPDEYPAYCECGNPIEGAGDRYQTRSGELVCRDCFNVSEGVEQARSQ